MVAVQDQERKVNQNQDGRRHVDAATSLYYVEHELMIMIKMMMNMVLKYGDIHIYLDVKINIYIYHHSTKSIEYLTFTKNHDLHLFIVKDTWA